jgi:hypothetical protein
LNSFYLISPFYLQKIGPFLIKVENICFQNLAQRVSKEAEFSNSIQKCADLFRQEVPKDFS